MTEISNVNRLRVKLFSTLLDIWETTAKDDTLAVAGKIGAIAPMAEEIKGIVLNSGKKNKVMVVNIDSIIPSDEIACWKTNEQTLKKIRNSIQKFGLKNPLVVRKVANAYQLISGSLLYEACKNLNMEKVLVILHECGEIEAGELGLLDAFSKSGVPTPDPRLINTVLRFYHRLLN